MRGHALRKKEALSIFYRVLGATSLGIGFYFALWFAVRPLYYRSMTYAIAGSEWLLFPLLFGLGALFWTLGTIELHY